MNRISHKTKRPLPDDKDTIGGGLLPTPEDNRDFSLAGVFGSVSPASVPIGDFFVGTPLKIKNQHSSDLCTAFSACTVSEYQEGVELNPEFFFAMLKRQRGEFTEWGGDLRSGCKAAQKIGFIEQTEAPFTLEDKERNFIANWNNWPVALQGLAQKHVKKSFFVVDGPNDTFDNIRVALWQNRALKRAVYTGCLWRPGWTNAPKGIIPNRLIAGGFGHAFTIDGVKYFSGAPYLRIVNSAGDGVGDNGFYYMSREVANRELTYRSYMFIDMEVEVAKELNEKALNGIHYNQKTNNNWFSKLLKQLRNYIK